MPVPRPKLKPLSRQTFTEATSTSGKVFEIGDIIEAVDPMGQFVEVKITAFYEDVTGQIWAIFQPLNNSSTNTWERGCIRLEALNS